jgi:hypothetical protein
MSINTASPQIPAITAIGRVSLVHQIVAFIEALLLAVWLGSMIFFSFAVAPSAFAVLPARELAGALVTSTIGKVEVLGLIIGPVLILIQLTAWKLRRVATIIRTLRLVLLAVMTCAAAASRFWISPTMVSLRESLGRPIDELALADPLRIQFNDLHQYSVAAMSVALFAGLAVLFLTVRSWLTR